MDLKPFELNEEDFVYLEGLGISLDEVRSQCDKLTLPRSRQVEVLRPCALGDGVFALQVDEAKQRFLDFGGSFAHFIPASGKASRMVSVWIQALSRGFPSQSSQSSLAKSMKRFPFWDVIEARFERLGWSKLPLTAALEQKLLRFVLDYPPLSLRHSPKALIPFHRYDDPERGVYTPMMEHIEEADHFARQTSTTAQLFLSASPEEKLRFERAAAAFISRRGLAVSCSVKVQDRSSQTLAMNGKGAVVRDDEGRVLLRPSGHGALLPLLSELDADMVFIKNIDNVRHALYKPEVTRYKMALGGMLWQAKQKVAEMLDTLKQDRLDTSGIDALAQTFCGLFGSVFTSDFYALSCEEKRSILQEKLDRPLRICGMVRNTNQAGGGPYWVRADRWEDVVQIMEQVEVVHLEQRLKQGDYFNPVFMVLAYKDYRNHLGAYVDNKAYLVSQKQYEGRQIKILEKSGLWNGSMFGWNSIFVEIPESLFTPVKSMDDLLSPQHQPQAKGSF